MCIVAQSESGHGGRFDPCEEYKRLQSENAALRQDNQLLRAENANLSMAHGPGNHTDWMLTRASKYEQLHKDLESLRQERDRLAGIVEKADALAHAMENDCRGCEEACCYCGFPKQRKAYQDARHAK